MELYSRGCERDEIAYTVHIVLRETFAQVAALPGGSWQSWRGPLRTEPNSTDDGDTTPPNPDPLGIGGDASQPLINPRNPLNLGGSLISAPLGGGGGGSVGKVLDNPNVLRNTLVNAALPLVPPPAPLPPPPVNVTDCVNATFIDGGCPLLTPTTPAEAAGGSGPPTAPTDRYLVPDGLGANNQATLPPAVPWVQATLPPVAPPFQPANVPTAPSGVGAPPADQGNAPWWQPSEFAPGPGGAPLCHAPACRAPLPPATPFNAGRTTVAFVLGIVGGRSLTPFTVQSIERGRFGVLALLAPVVGPGNVALGGTRLVSNRMGADGEIVVELEVAMATTQRFSDVVAGVLEGTAGNGELARSLQAHGLAVSAARVLALTITDVSPQAGAPFPAPTLTPAPAAPAPASAMPPQLGAAGTGAAQAVNFTLVVIGPGAANTADSARNAIRAALSRLVPGIGTEHIYAAPATPVTASMAATQQLDAQRFDNSEAPVQAAVAGVPPAPPAQGAQVYQGTPVTGLTPAQAAQQAQQVAAQQSTAAQAAQAAGRAAPNQVAAAGAGVPQAAPPAPPPRASVLAVVTALSTASNPELVSGLRQAGLDLLSALITVVNGVPTDVAAAPAPSAVQAISFRLALAGVPAAEVMSAAGANAVRHAVATVLTVVGPSQVGVATRTFAPVTALGGRRRLQAPGDLTELTVSVVPTPDNFTAVLLGVNLLAASNGSQLVGELHRQGLASATAARLMSVNGAPVGRQGAGRAWEPWASPGPEPAPMLGAGLVPVPPPDGHSDRLKWFILAAVLGGCVGVAMLWLGVVLVARAQQRAALADPHVTPSPVYIPERDVRRSPFLKQLGRATPPQARRSAFGASPRTLLVPGHVSSSLPLPPPPPPPPPAPPADGFPLVSSIGTSAAVHRLLERAAARAAAAKAERDSARLAPAAAAAAAPLGTDAAAATAIASPSINPQALMAGAIPALAAAAEAEAARPRQPATPPVGKPATATAPAAKAPSRADEPDFLSMGGRTRRSVRAAGASSGFRFQPVKGRAAQSVRWLGEGSAAHAGPADQVSPRSPRLEAAREQLRGLEADGVGRLRRLASDAEERTGSPNPGPNPFTSLDRSPSPRRALLDSDGGGGGVGGGQLFNVALSSSERGSPAARAAAIFAAQAEQRSPRPKSLMRSRN
ncbi:hypothetical protein WJX81_002627 [Elliptochloris bilobata]|uniref:Uncharacterized protein n=1 Tax=Elliptochloris bilobata TaxID=381761 RepID=A0AAW1RC56_9CHLO